MSRAQTMFLLFLSGVITLLISFVGSSETANAIPTAEEYVFRRSWGAEGDKILLTGGWGDIAIGLKGDVYIANVGLNRITRFSPVNRTFNTYGNLGADDGQFNAPTVLTVDTQGNIFIVDSGNDRIQKLNSQGEYVTQWSNEGRDLAVDGSNNVYLVDNVNHRIIKYNNSGQYLSEWGTQGSGLSQFESPQGIAVDRQSDFIYVADTGNDRVQKFAANGSYLAQWGSSGTGNGQFNSPTAVAVNDGIVYVADDTRIQQFTSGGEYIKQCALPDNSHSFAVDTNGSIYVLAGSWLGYVYKYNNNCQLEATWGNHINGDWIFYWMHDVAVDGQGRVFINDGSFGTPVHVFDKNGTHLAAWGDIAGPGDIAVDTNNNLYQLDGNAPTVFKYSVDGSVITEIESFDLGEPSAIDLDPSGNIYVGQWVSGIVKLDNVGNTITQWTQQGGPFVLISGVALDSNNNVYLIDWNNQVQKYTSNGAFLSSWGSTGNGIGQFSYSEDLTVDSSNNIYVADTGNDRIQKFTSDGAFITSWGEYGTGDGQFEKPNGIDVDDEGNIYVVERDIYRVQVFSLGYPPPDPVSGLILNGSFESSMNLTEWAYGGSLPVATSGTRASLGNSSLLLGMETGQVPQEEGIAWAHQTIYIDPAWDRPVLSFDYKMFVNDTIDFSDFFVAIQDGSGRNHLATVLRDGFQSCLGNVAPPAKTELDWRTYSQDLSLFKGQNIRLFFSNRNLHDGSSLGIWTFVDNIRVVDSGPLPSGGPESVFLPTILNNYEPTQDCDPVSYSSLNAYDNLLLRAMPEN